VTLSGSETIPHRSWRGPRQGTSLVIFAAIHERDFPLNRKNFAPNPRWLPRPHVTALARKQPTLFQLTLARMASDPLHRVWSCCGRAATHHRISSPCSHYPYTISAQVWCPLF